MKHFKKFFSIVLISVMALSTINVAFAGDLSYNSYIDTSKYSLDDSIYDIPKSNVEDIVSKINAEYGDVGLSVNTSEKTTEVTVGEFISNLRLLPKKDRKIKSLLKKNTKKLQVVATMTLNGNLIIPMIIQQKHQLLKLMIKLKK